MVCGPDVVLTGKGRHAGCGAAWGKFPCRKVAAWKPFLCLDGLDEGHYRVAVFLA